MPSTRASTLICQIDNVVWHRHAIFGFGWALDRVAIIDGGRLLLHFPDGASHAVRLSMERSREDVLAAFPDVPQAARAGFMFMAGWGDVTPVRAELVFEMADGCLQRRDLDLSSPASGPAGLGLSVEHRYLLRRGLAHLRQGRIGELIHKALQQIRPRAKPAEESSQKLSAALHGQPCRLVVDHSMGGGANFFRERLVADWLAAGETSLVLSFRLATMSAVLEVHSPRQRLTVSLRALDEMHDILAGSQLTEIFFNCAVSFPNAAQVQQLLMTLKSRFGSPLVVAVHEYFLVCPSPFLLDSSGQFCGLPSAERCKTCLAGHDDGFASLTGERSIERWRAMWGEVLGVAEEVRCFSASTQRLLASAYPFTAARMTLRPHKVDALRTVRRRRDSRPGLTVGVIGAILAHKGAQVVAALAEAIADAGADIRIVVVGSIDAACPAHVVTQTGPYQRDALPDLIEQQRIDIALLPSVCPETFSFVAHEIASMGLPLLTLDIGAQADLARSLPNGWVSSRQDGPGLLAEILAFDRHLHPLRLKVLA